MIDRIAVDYIRQLLQSRHDLLAGLSESYAQADLASIFIQGSDRRWEDKWDMSNELLDQYTTVKEEEEDDEDIDGEGDYE